MKHKADPTQRPLYLNDTGTKSVPITIERLSDAMREARHSMDGCLELVEHLAKNNPTADFHGPFLMLRLTLRHGISELCSVTPDLFLPVGGNQ